MLLSLLIIPVVGALWAALSRAERARSAALVSTLVFFAATAAMGLLFDWSRAAEMQLTQTWSMGVGGGDRPGPAMALGVDGVSALLILLTGLLAPLCVLGSFSAITDRQRTFYAWLTLLQAPMVGAFMARDLITFYVSFELTLLPMFVLIAVFGSTNRKAASVKFFLYTFTGSILTLAALAYVVWFNATGLEADGFGAGEWSFAIDALQRAAQRMSGTEQGWVLLGLLAGFAVKTPLFPVHTWLPLAHTEAPTAGSVVLAGVLLKLGTYGLYRFVLPFVPAAVMEYAPAIGLVSVIGVIYGGLICWAQRDVKKLVAYSSVSHLGFCVLGLFALNVTGATGSVLYMLNHGLSTGALFFCIGMMYERYHTRSLEEVGGLASKMPVWSAFMVFFTMSSVGLPGLNGFVSEFLCLLGAWQSGATWGVGGTAGTLGPVFGGVAATGVIVSAIYLLYMLGRLVWGPLREPHGHGHHHGDDGHALPPDLTRREILVLAPLAALCLVLGVYPKVVIDPVEQAVTVVLPAGQDAAAAQHAEAGR